ncbi:uncharacterized protein K452DRAFT_352624 [Aplosporella prunicola CBS 121167]|uniref:Uncharacterized protein n=1 Tax=Aplosporella prunicola CBS 121167 TaxID=1176127 RepID=A0A6A6B6V7_9PEZI|nr:uncharacterized protein K452DRAFT_352624 [Aplosporella prunicola CBS 121167]KAF2139378.1 hypothetical protein K452DRAFT_352624 [Aplosporella prunicola CBS 121167]
MADAKTNSSRRNYHEPLPIAVVGLACRFPGDATSPTEFWNFICNARTALTEIPKDRFNIDAFYHPSPARQGAINVRGGYFLKEDIAAFDAPFFSMTAEEAVCTDPQQRLLLETAYESIENAGIPISEIAGTETSCYVGTFMKDYQQISAYDSEDQPGYGATGHSSALLANRISWFFDLRSSSVTIDTGCSGSTVAFHHACESLRTGEAKIALAGGVGALLSPDPMVSMVSFNFLSPDSKCYSFDHRANGYARGEGFSVLVLKPLSDAIRDNDNIRAVVRGSAVNQDGRTPGITLPSTEAQVRLIRSAYQKARLPLDQTRYFEAHGTGTSAGDAAELRAIAKAFGHCRTVAEPMLVGSVKTNIGHLEGCAGLAGILKTILCLENGVIPQNLWFEKAHPDNNLDEFRIKIPQKLTPWPSSNGVRRASVNCFGFGGESAHIILDSTESFLGQHHANSTPSSRSGSGSSSGFEMIDFPGTVTTNEQPRLFIWSSPESNGVSRTLKAQSEYLSSKTETTADSQSFVRDLSYTLCHRRSIFPWRSTIVAGSLEELLHKLQKDVREPCRSLDSPSLTFVFTGQGAQWHAMGRELYSYDAFRRSLQQADAHMSSIGAEWSIVDELFIKSKEETRVNDAQYAQPLCTALQLATVDLLQTWNIKPTTVVGHSSGEIAAAYAAGVLSHKDALIVAYHRGRLCSTAYHGNDGSSGAMLAVNLSREEAEAEIAKVTQGKLVVACLNGPRQITLSGDASAIEEAIAILTSQDISSKRLLVDHAYHSSHMKRIESEYLKSLKGIAPQTTFSKLPRIFSTVYGKRVTTQEFGTPNYWAQNLVSPVQFYPAMQRLLREHSCKPDAIVELGPHNVLRGYIAQIAASIQAGAPLYTSVLQRGKNAKETALSMAGDLWSKGFPVALKRLSDAVDESLRLLKDLPSYPWNHSKTYWHEARASKAYRFRKYPRLDLLGGPTPDSTNLDHRWRNIIRVKELPWVCDHRVQNTILYPGAGMITMVLEAARQFESDDSPATGYELHDVKIGTAMVIPNAHHGLETKLRILPETGFEDKGAKRYNFAISSRIQDEAWRENCTGALSILYDDNNEASANWSIQKGTLSKASADCRTELAPNSLYEKFEKAGLEYGRLFRNITELRTDGLLTCSSISIPNTAAVMPMSYEHAHLIHPACLDSMFQTVVMSASDAMVPTSIKYCFVAADVPKGAGSKFQGYTEVSTSGLRSTMGTIVMTDSQMSGPKVVLEGVGFTSLTSAQVGDADSANFARMRSKICSGFRWKEDVTLLTPEQLKDFLDRKRTPVDKVVDFFDLVGHNNPEAAILEIGGGPIHMADNILRKLCGSEGNTPRFSRYVWTSSNHKALSYASEGLSHWKSVSFKNLDFNMDLASQNFNDGAYDVVLMPLGFLDASDTTEVFQKIRRLLRIGGRLLLTETLETHESTISSGPKINPEKMDYEMEQSSPSGEIPIRKRKTSPIELSLSTNAAYKRSRDCQLPFYRTSGLDKLLRHNDFSGIDFQLAADSNSSTTDTDVAGFLSQLVVSTAQAEGIVNKEVLIIDSVHNPNSIGIIAIKLMRQLSSFNIHWRVASLEEAVSDIGGQKLCISLLEVENIFLHGCSEKDFTLFQKLLRTSGGLLWVTKGAQLETPRPGLAPVMGVFRSARSEDSGLALHTLDLSTKKSDPLVCAKAIARTFTAIFGSKTKVEEYEFAERRGVIYIPRIIEYKKMNKAVLQQCGTAPPVLEKYGTRETPLDLVVGTVGDLKSLHFVHGERPEQLTENKVEVRVEANDVSLQDALTVIGQTSTAELGFGFAGVVSRIGSNVDRINIGDRVMALCRGAYRSTLCVPQEMVQPIPDSISFEVAASLPVDYATAHYALNVVARLQGIDTILVLDAANGLGQAAVRLARQCGAEIFATTEVEEERELLRTKQCIPEDHILDSRPSYFTSSIKQITNGRGVDVVFSSVTGSALQRATECVTHFGRFLQVYKTRQARQSAPVFDFKDRNVTISFVDLENIWTRNPALCASLLHGLQTTFESTFSPPPLNVFPCSDLEGAFRQASDGDCKSKTILKLNKDAMVPIMPLNEHPLRLEPTATYIIVGGLGGIGQSVMRMLVKHGARNLAAMSRSGIASEKDSKFCEELRSDGAVVRVYRCDISQEKSLKMTLAQMAHDEMPPIRGVINSAMALKDVLFESMSHADYLTATNPKILGSWNLHKLLPPDLDFFVMFSSVAGISGTRGQANYAAGNAFQVALCQHRRALGLKAVALDLTITVGLGFVAGKDDLMQMLKRMGVLTISEEELHALVANAITGYSTGLSVVHPEVMVGISTGGMLQHNRIDEPMWNHDNRFAYMRKIDVVSDESFSDTSLPSLRTALPAAGSLMEARNIIIAALATKLARSLMMPVEDMDTSKPVNAYGVDSLVAVEIRNWIFREIRANVSIFDLLSNIAISELGENIARGSELVSKELLA